MDASPPRYPLVSSDSDRSNGSNKTGDGSSFVVVLDSIVEGASKLRVKDRSETLDTADTWESASVASDANGCGDSDTNEDARSNEFECPSYDDDWHSETYCQDGRDYYKDDAYLLDDSYFLDETEFSQGLVGYGDDLANDEKELETDIFWDFMSHAAPGLHGGLRPSTLPVLAPIVEERSFDSM